MRPSVLGLELGIAKERLQSVGVRVLAVECSSRKGVPDADASVVIRQRDMEDCSELVYSKFRLIPDGLCDEGVEETAGADSEV